MALVEDRNGIWYMNFQVCGRRIHRSTRLRSTKGNLAKAEQIAAKERERISNEQFFGIREAIRKKFGDAADDFLKWARVTRKIRTYRHYKSSLQSARKFFNQRPLVSIQKGDLERYRIWRVTHDAVSVHTAADSLLVLSALFSYGMVQRWCLENPVRGMKLPPKRRRTRVLSFEEERLYFAAATDRKRPQHCGRVACLMLQQGMRPEEVLRLRNTDVDLEAGKLYIREGKTPAAIRTLDLISESREVLAKCFTEGRARGTTSYWLFPSPENVDRPLEMHTVYSVHKTIIKTAGLSYFPPYTFRHTFATRMNAAGVDLHTIAALMGHSNTHELETYIHIMAGPQKAAMKRYATIRRKQLGRNSS